MTNMPNADCIKKLTQHWKNEIFGIMTDENIKDAMLTNDLFIYPFSKSSLTGVGYNLHPSDVIISTKTGMPLKEYYKAQQKYVIIQPHDTVLISTREYIKVSREIIGTIHSRVSIVSQGFGHISTTLDPKWEGPLLIALNNPSSGKKKLILEENGHSHSFATLIFYHLKTSSTSEFEASPNRIDILNIYRAKPGTLKKMIFHKKLKSYNEFIDKIQDITDKMYENKIVDDRLLKLEEVVLDTKKLFNKESCKLQTHPDLLPLADRFKVCQIECQPIREYDNLRSMIEIFIGSILNISSKESNLPSSDMEILKQSMLSYCDVCLYQLNYITIASRWVREYRVLAAQSQINMQGFIMRIVFGDFQSATKKVICFLLTIAVILTVYYLSKTSNNLNLTSVVASAMVTFIFNIVLNKFIK